MCILTPVLLGFICNSFSLKLTLGTEVRDFYSSLHWQQQWLISPFMESNQVCLTRFYLDSEELFVSFVSCSKTGSLIPARFKAFYWAALNFDFENCYMYHCQVPRESLLPIMAFTGRIRHDSGTWAWTNLGISVVEVYERVGKSVISVCKKSQNG